MKPVNHFFQTDSMLSIYERENTGKREVNNVSINIYVTK